MIATETQGPPAKRFGQLRSMSWKVAVCENLTVPSPSHFSPAWVQVFSPPIISVAHLPCLLLFLSQLLAALPSFMASFQIQFPLLKIMLSSNFVRK